MICYKDMTFCTYEKCAKWTTCHRALTPKAKVDADKWWSGEKGEAPICIYSDKPYCYEVKK